MKIQRANVRVKKLHPDAVIPKYARMGDAGFDLCAVEDVIIAPGQTVVVKTGLAFGLPEGYELQVRPRSGVSTKSMLRIVLGTVDYGYRGEVGVIVDNVARHTYNSVSRTIDGRGVIDRNIEGNSIVIRKGDRIAQGVLTEVPMARFEEVDELDETERGARGFGSTGVK